MAEKTPCPSTSLGMTGRGLFRRFCTAELFARLGGRGVCAHAHVVRGAGTEGPGRFPSHLSKRERWGTRHCFGRPPADLIDGDLDTNRVPSSTSSDYLHIKGTPRRFSAGRESQR